MAVLVKWISAMITYLQPFSSDSNLASHTTQVACYNLINDEWQYLRFNTDAERQTFEKLSMAVLFTLRVSTRNMRIRLGTKFLRVQNFWGLSQWLSFNKPTYLLLGFQSTGMSYKNLQERFRSQAS